MSKIKKKSNQKLKQKVGHIKTKKKREDAAVSEDLRKAFNPTFFEHKKMLKNQKMKMKKKPKIITKKGKKFIRVGDLTIDPNNKRTYNNPKKEKANQQALRISFTGRKKRDLHIQEQPLMIRKDDLLVVVGNSRTKAALDEFGPDELMWIEWHEQKEKTTATQEFRDRYGSNIHRDHGWNEKYNILTNYWNGYYIDMGVPMSIADFKRVCKEYQTTPESYKLCKEIVDIQGNAQDLMDLDNKESKHGNSLQEIHRKITKYQSKKFKPNPKAIDFGKFFKDNPNIAKKAIDDLKNELRFIRGRTLTNRNRKNPVNLIFDFQLGWEKGQFTGVVSNMAQSCFANAISEYHLVQTPIGREGDADIVFPDLNKINCEKVKLEVKSSSVEDGKIKGNMRAGQMKKNWHLFVLHQDECRRLAIMVVPVDGDIWSSSSNSKKVETTYQTILENHGKDAVFLLGDYFLDNNKKYQIAYERF